MLPFKKEGSIAGPVEIKERTPDEPKEYNFLEDVMMDLINAIHSKDKSGAAEALRAAFELFDSEPHEEGPHV